MAEVIRMPEVLAGAAEAAIQTWLVTPGTTVAAGQPLAEIETDKAIVELTAESAGNIGRLLASEGDSVAVGDAILVMLAEGEGDVHIAPALAAAGVRPPAESVIPEPEIAAESANAPGSVTAESAIAPPQDSGGGAAEGKSSGRLFVSPIVRRLAAQAGVSLTAIQGTGPRGRIVRRDLERYLAAERQDVIVPEPTGPGAAAPATSPSSMANYQDVPLDRMRKAIARRLTESKSTIPHFYLVADCRIDALMKLRTEINASAPRRISVNDFVVKAVAAALLDVPAANAAWNDDSIRQFSSVDIAVAVATDGGLTTPVLRAVERMSLSKVSETVAEMAERARAGRLKQHELEGGSFSVSNLGMYGTTQFSAILNPPQSGILAVGAARKVPVVGDNDQVTVATVMTVTLSADHRVLDGAVAAKWLAALQRHIESPLTILI